MTLTSQYDGTCKVCNKTWKVGNQLWYQKDPKAICIDEQCFEAQKAAAGAPHPAQGMADARAVQNPTRTESERTEDCKHMIEILWGMAEAKALEVIPKREAGEQFADHRDRLIFAEVLYKSLTYNWTRP